MSRLYILYDSRACDGDTFDASVLEVFFNNREAKGRRGQYGGMACFSYVRLDDGELTDERFEWNWFGD